MAEEHIKITIRPDGTLESDSLGIKGEACLEELQALLGELADVSNPELTREYHEPPRRRLLTQAQRNIQKLGGGKS